jgi:hypothetical protein
MEMVMAKTACRYALALPLGLSLLLTAAPSFADKPSWAGGGDRGGRSERYDDERRNDNDRRYDDRRGGDRRDDRRYDDDRRGSGGSIEFRFGDRERSSIRDYYGSEFRSGNCPPGLAKKHNGCLPPGQARKWAMGRPLPRDVEMYDLPRDLVIRLGVPPAGYRYVRVASDILLISVGTSMVVDAIQDLGGF